MVRSADLAGTFRGDADARTADIFATRARERGPETQPANPFTETVPVNDAYCISTRLLGTAKEPQQTVEYCDRVRWTTRDVEIDRKQTFDAVRDLGAAAEQTAGNGARACGDDQPGVGHRFVGDQQGLAHVRGHRPGDQDAVRMTRRGDELDAEPPGVEHDVAQ